MNHFSLTPFDFHPQTRVVYGTGVINRLGELVQELDGKKVFLVTDKGLAEAGHAQHAVDVLDDAGLNVTVYSEVHCNPTTEDVDTALEVARKAKVDLIVGLGGGSSMDCAKGVNFLLTNGGKMQDYWGVGKATKPMLPMIAVPTTAGTGSEAQSFALISDAKTHVKMACGDKKAACKVAVLDPELTTSMPSTVAAATGIDAISHAIETYVTKPRNSISQLFSRQAWQLLSHAFPIVFEDPANLDARGAMLLGAHYAGMAIENSMLGATHALANPLTAHHDLTHGVAIGVMLPHVIRFNGSSVGRLYGDVASDAGLCDATDPAAPQLLADFVTKLVRCANSPTTLQECEIPAEQIATFAADATKQWTGTFNPRSLEQTDFQELYECAMSNVSCS